MTKIFSFIKYAVIFVLGLYSTASFANIFGPKNYEACVLEQMKGQDASLLSTARRYCYRKFPDEQQIPNDLLKWEWCESNNFKQKLCLKNMPKDIEITKVIGEFTTVDCDLWDRSTQTEKVEGTKSRFSNNISFKTPSANYKCSKFIFFGYDRR